MWVTSMRALDPGAAPEGTAISDYPSSCECRLNQNHFWEMPMPRLIRLRLKVHNRLALALLLCLSAPWPALAEDIQAPPVGRVFKYTCQGDLGHELHFLVRSIENGDVHSEVTIDGRAGFLVKPPWFFVSSLYKEMQTTKGEKLHVSSGLEAFDGLRSLTIGSVFQGDIVESAASGSSFRSAVTIKVVEERDFQSDALGTVRIIAVEEKITSGNETSFGRVYFNREHSVAVYWRFSLSNGKHQECRLSELHDK